MAFDASGVTENLDLSSDASLTICRCVAVAAVVKAGKFLTLFMSVFMNPCDR
jgi:hypothetical protein